MPHANYAFIGMYQPPSLCIMGISHTLQYCSKTLMDVLGRKGICIVNYSLPAWEPSKAPRGAISGL